MLPKIDDRQTTDRQTDGRAIAYSEREREFTFAKNSENSSQNKFYLPTDELNFTADKTNVSTFCRNRRPATLALIESRIAVRMQIASNTLQRYRNRINIRHIHIYLRHRWPAAVRQHNSSVAIGQRATCLCAIANNTQRSKRAKSVTRHVTPTRRLAKLERKYITKTKIDICLLTFKSSF